jgi:hypothetical protein
MHVPGVFQHFLNNFLLVGRRKPDPERPGDFLHLFMTPQHLDSIEKIVFKMEFEKVVGDKIAGHPPRLCAIQSAAGNEDMYMHMPGQASAKGVHDHHEAGVIMFVSKPLPQRLMHHRVEGVKVGLSANAEVAQKLMGRAEDDMLVLTLRKERGIRLNPDIRLSHAATGTEAGFTGMRNLFLIPALRALVVMEAHLFRAACKHLLHIAGNTCALDLGWMGFRKGVVPIRKDLF